MLSVFQLQGLAAFTTILVSYNALPYTYFSTRKCVLAKNEILLEADSHDGLCWCTVHEVLGLKGNSFQSLYHFTVGIPIVDKRIQQIPAYPGPIDANF
jgi:hypothetical protein